MVRKERDALSGAALLPMLYVAKSHDNGFIDPKSGKAPLA
ncbi:hypothetical protein GGI59_004234 [Rhizobium lentis]|uniref:Uncharacterized protein n=1 Tax=Rhizobium lentis TaxID=1138194 RepID=A0A7W9CWL2_9HYPH|nr:hypothetical protein [Rhizobium lentis]MBB5552007.1 hypothetical protein [Rhizobium lentis]MBB5562545.1 hypothetical protein [Rhizobium lentis]MBB5569908.1 hypothetical protein [Rhizobium lentis]